MPGDQSERRIQNLLTLPKRLLNASSLPSRTLSLRTPSLRCVTRLTSVQNYLEMRKQLDPRIPILINNNVKKNHRSFIVLVGDKGRDQVCTLRRAKHAGNVSLCVRLSTCTSCFLKHGYLHDPLYFGVTRRSLGSQGAL